MRGVLVQEWIRIRTLRSTWWLSGSSVVVTTLLAITFTVTAGSLSAIRAGTPGASGVLGDQESFAIVLSSSTQLATLFMGLMGVFAFGHDYRYATILPCLTSAPRRSRVAAARLLGIALWSSIVGVVCLAASALVVLTLGSGRFAAEVGFDDSATLRVAAGSVLLLMLFGLFGLALGWLFRAIPVAVSLLFALPIAVEPLLRLVLSIQALEGISGVGRFLPFTAGAQLVAYTTRVDPSVPEALRNDLSPLVGGLTLTSVVAALIVLSYLLFQRRDA